MTTEEIKQHLQVGCTVQMKDGFYVLVDTILPDQISFRNNTGNRFYILDIKTITKWPIPKYIDNGWIKFKQPISNPVAGIQFTDHMKSYVDKWQKVTGQLYGQIGCIIDRNPDHVLPDNIDYWKIRREWITDWRPLSIEEQHEYSPVSLYTDITTGDEIKFSHTSPWLTVTATNKRPDGDIEITYLHLQDNNKCLVIARPGIIYSARRKKNTKPIYKFEDIQPGWWVKLYSEQEIRKKIQSSNNYNYNYTDKKINICSNKWHEVKYVNSRDITTQNNWYWEKDFIAEISPPNLHTEETVVINPQHLTSNLAVGSGIAIGNMTSQTIIKQEETIMLNTVEEIKKLEPANLAEAAKKVKEQRDNDEVQQAREKLNELLDKESKLKKQKETIDKELEEVQSLIKAFGYPPESNSK